MRNPTSAEIDSFIQDVLAARLPRIAQGGEKRAKGNFVKGYTAQDLVDDCHVETGHAKELLLGLNPSRVFCISRKES